MKAGRQAGSQICLSVDCGVSLPVSQAVSGSVGHAVSRPACLTGVWSQSVSLIVKCGVNQSASQAVESDQSVSLSV